MDNLPRPSGKPAMFYDYLTRIDFFDANHDINPVYLKRVKSGAFRTQMGIEQVDWDIVLKVLEGIDPRAQRPRRRTRYQDCLKIYRTPRRMAAPHLPPLTFVDSAQQQNEVRPRPFVCPTCSRRYRHQGFLDLHVTKKHKAAVSPPPLSGTEEEELSPPVLPLPGLDDFFNDSDIYFA